MRRQIIECLTFPRLAALDRIKATGCPNDAVLVPADDACAECDLTHECRWLLRNNEFAVLATKPLPELVDALHFAIDYVRQDLARVGHRGMGCVCRSCVWLRDARRLLNRAEGKTLSA